MSCCAQKLHAQTRFTGQPATFSTNMRRATIQTPNSCKRQKEAADERMAISFRARNALEDFEAQEW